MKEGKNVRSSVRQTFSVKLSANIFGQTFGKHFRSNFRQTFSVKLSANIFGQTFGKHCRSNFRQTFSVKLSANIFGQTFGKHFRSNVRQTCSVKRSASVKWHLKDSNYFLSKFFVLRMSVSFPFRTKERGKKLRNESNPALKKILLRPLEIDSKVNKSLESFYSFGKRVNRDFFFPPTLIAFRFEIPERNSQIFGKLLVNGSFYFSSAMRNRERYPETRVSLLSYLSTSISWKKYALYFGRPGNKSEPRKSPVGRTSLHVTGY